MLLDVREPKEFEGGRLPAAIHIPLSQLAGRANELAKLAARPVIAYCASGRRSRMAGGALAKAGFKDIYSLAGRARRVEEGRPARGEVRRREVADDALAITMYTTATCPFCVQAERYLNAKGVTRDRQDPGRPRSRAAASR